MMNSSTVILQGQDKWMELSASGITREQLYLAGKRLLDLILALTFILLFSPFYLLLALLTFASSRTRDLQAGTGRQEQQEIYPVQIQEHGT